MYADLPHQGVEAVSDRPSAKEKYFKKYAKFIK